jgi:hypothetical protein
MVSTDLVKPRTSVVDKEMAVCDEDQSTHVLIPLLEHTEKTLRSRDWAEPLNEAPTRHLPRLAGLTRL